MENNSSGSSPGLESFDIVIIGASGGIGQYLVRSFLPANRIIGTYYKHTPDTLIQGPRYYYANLADAQSVSNFCVAIADGLLRPVIIYTPGISPNRLAHKMSDAEWEEAWRACPGSEKKPAWCLRREVKRSR